MSSKHRVIKKNFETEMRVNDSEIPLNHFVQETLANIMVGFLKTLKELDETPRNIKIEIRRLPETRGVDAHTYP